jgi:two-component system, OmpR family, response regulator
MSPYVLVVESDPELQRRIGDTLSEARYALAAETETGWAKRSMLIQPPDAFIIDTSLADGSGFALAEEIRRTSDTEHAPIFFVASTHRGASHASEAKRRFAPAEYLPTPLDVSRLLALLLEMVPPTETGPMPVVPNYPGSAILDQEDRRERRSVENAAKQLGTGPDLRGSLARQPFARVLQRIYVGRLTGALLLTTGQTKKIIYTENGYPVAARSNVPDECLGQILLQQRMISSESLTESLRRMKESKKRQGELLVEMGALSPYNLSRALVLQMEAKLLELFSWREGRFSFKKGETPQEQLVRLERSPAALILEGIRRYYDAERIHAVLAPFAGQFIMPSPDRRQRLQDITSDPHEQGFIASLDGSTKFEAALASTLIPTDRARLLLVAMAEAGMISPSATATSNRTAEGVAVTDAPQRTGERSRDDLAAIHEVMNHQTHFEILALDREASEPEVDTAYEVRAREFHPDRFRLRPEEVRVLAERIFERLEEAHAVLSDPTARRRYLAQLDRSRPPKPAAADETPAGESPHVVAERVYFQGVAHLRARRYRDAAEAFRKASTLAPGQSSYRSALGWATYRQAPADVRAVATGLAELLAAVETDPKNPWSRVSLGRFYAETGKPDEAVRIFEEVLRMSPGLSDIEEEIRRLRGVS